MRHVVISSIDRPHITEPNIRCWCIPTIDGDLIIHKNVNLFCPHSMAPVASTFSEQRPRS